MTSEGVSGLYGWVLDDPDFPPHEPDFDNMKDVTPRAKELPGPDDLDEGQG